MTRNEMSRLKDGILRVYYLLLDRKLRKARQLCEGKGIEFVEELQNRLGTKNHLENKLFNEEDLRVGMVRDKIEEEKESVEELKGGEISNSDWSRVTGHFISGSVVNLSRKNLTEEPIKLLSFTYS